jgi:TonB family protein
MIAAALLASLAVVGDVELPRLERGGASTPAATVVGGGVAVLEVTVEGGRAVGTRRLSGGEAWLELLERDVSGWLFSPADASGQVLAVGVYRPPQLSLDAELSPGSPREASESLPFPERPVAPAYPPGVVGDGAVIVEAIVGEDGSLSGERIVGSGSAFDSVALRASAGWRFRPARKEGRSVPARVCLVFGFRAPVVAPHPH